MQKLQRIVEVFALIWSCHNESADELAKAGVYRKKHAMAVTDGRIELTFHIILNSLSSPLVISRKSSQQAKPANSTNADLTVESSHSSESVLNASSLGTSLQSTRWQVAVGIAQSPMTPRR